MIQILERSQAKRLQGRANPIIGTAVATGAANALGSQVPRLDCQLPVASVQKLGARNITGTNIVESTEVRTIFWASVIASRSLPDAVILALITNSPSDFKRKWSGKSNCVRQQLPDPYLMTMGGAMPFPARTQRVFGAPPAR